MSISLQTNVNALTAQDNLRVTSDFQSKTIQRLTSGYRINSSGDDAAGLAIANKFRSDTAELSQGVRNANDGISQLQIVDGGMNNISKMLDRLRTLATQSASGTFAASGRSVVNSEFQSLLSEIDRQSQSIGLNTGGTFAKSLSVYIGGGSGSQSIANAQVSVDLTKSTVDSQSLGLKGMQALNVTYSADGTTNTGTDIGASAGNHSVAHILAAATGNQMATAGYASFQISGAGFSDSGKVSISVNLASVTDVDSLATAVNQAIQGAPGGTTAFKNANIIASVHTDSSGGKELAFSSSSTAFQVQAGDQMANALLGKMDANGLGTAVNTANVSGVTTASAGAFTTPANVHLVISGGGLASPVDLHLATGSTTISGAITDFENQFKANSSLVAAGLTMSGSTTAGGGALSFNSNSGQQFNVQVSGDSANLLGLGSFLASNTGQADYTSLAATGAYSQSTVTGTPTTTGVAAGLEISLNGGASQALTSIDLTAGANAAAASATSSASIGSGAVDITASNANLDITVINNGVATNHAFALSTNQVAAAGTLASTAAGLKGDANFAGYTASAGAHNDKFVLTVDGTAHTVTLDGTFAAGAVGAGLFLTALNTALGATGATANFDATSKELTFTSATQGSHSSVAVSGATYASVAAPWSTVTNPAADTLNAPVTTSATHNSFDIALDGGQTYTVAVANNTYNTASGLVAAIQAGINAVGALNGKVTAGFDATTHQLTLTDVSGATGATSSINLSLTTGNDGLTILGYGPALTRGLDAAANTGLANIQLNANTSTVAGTDDAPTTLQSIATQIQTQFGGAAKVTVSNDNKISIASTTKGANSSVAINAPASNGANATLNLTTPTAVLGLNSSIQDVVDNLNAQFSNNATWRAADLHATVGDGTHVTIFSGNNTSFRLNALGAGAASAEDIGFGTAGTTFTGATPSSTSAMSTLDAFGVSQSTALDFNPLKYGSDSQAITISANDSTGALQTNTITLANVGANRSGRSIDEAIAYINQQLQANNSQPALQQITAVKENVGGSEKINFVSSLPKFTVGVSNCTNSGGINGGASTTKVSQANGSAATMAVDTQQGAQQAVVAISAAIAALGSAQAAVGKGQNQLNYAVTLAQSQISNFSAAESRIRDADVAAEAANLTKAQVLVQAAMAAMAQANSAPQAVLALLR